MKIVKSWVALATLFAVSMALAAAQKHPKNGRYSQFNLVSNIPGRAAVTDTNLVNAWGIVVIPTGRVWVANNGTGLTTVYRGDGARQNAVVPIPGLGGVGSGLPTGMVGNDTDGFVVSNAPASFIWATEDGTIAAWNTNLAAAVIVVDNSATGAVYKAIARATNEFIFATNFHDGTVEKYDTNFQFVSAFTDTNLPAGYAPFGIENINGKLFVTFALQDASKTGDVEGPGHGYVDVFDTDGNLLQQFAAQGPLNSPWGIALAPEKFGAFSDAVLVGNFGDGHINAYDATTGQLLGTIVGAHNVPIAIDGLWGLSFGDLSDTKAQASTMAGMSGNKSRSRPHPILYFAAGPYGESEGLMGYLAPGKKKPTTPGY